MSIEREYDAGRVGMRIRKIRKAHGLSQSQFALRAGISASAVGNWEQGLSRPGLNAAVKIIEAFDMTLDYLYLGRMHTLRHGVATQLIGLLDANE